MARRRWVFALGCIARFMKIEFQLTGEGELPPTIESAAVPQKGDTIEYQHASYLVKGIRFLVENKAARIVAEIERAAE